jgi:hypothetical protein
MTKPSVIIILSMYRAITSTKSPSFSMTTLSASLTNLMTLLPPSHDRSYYVSRPILAPTPLWLQKHTDIRGHEFAQSAYSWHQPRLANVTCSRSGRLCGINPAIRVYIFMANVTTVNIGLYLVSNGSTVGEWRSTNDLKWIGRGIKLR